MSMQNGEFAQRFIQMLRPENVGNAAQTAITWLKPPPAPVAIKPLRFANFPVTLGRLGAPRQGCVRQDLRSSHGDRSRRKTVDRRKAAGGRHLSPAAPGAPLHIPRAGSR
jgi:hypothetical protein